MFLSSTYLSVVYFVVCVLLVAVLNKLCELRELICKKIEIPEAPETPITIHLYAFTYHHRHHAHKREAWNILIS